MEQQEKKVSLTLTVEDKPVSMLCRENDSVSEYGNVYNRKVSENKDEQAAIWTSMYEKNLGRKVSDLPPWIEPSKADRKFGDPDKMDLASIHMQRAAESGAAHSSPFIQTAEVRRHHRKHHHHHHKDDKTSRAPSSGREGILDKTIADFHEKMAEGEDSS